MGLLKVGPDWRQGGFEYYDQVGLFVSARKYELVEDGKDGKDANCKHGVAS